MLTSVSSPTPVPGSVFTSAAAVTRAASVS